MNIFAYFFHFFAKNFKNPLEKSLIYGIIIEENLGGFII